MIRIFVLFTAAEEDALGWGDCYFDSTCIANCWRDSVKKIVIVTGQYNVLMHFV